MNSVRVLNRSVFAAIFLVATCYGLQDLRLAYKMPRSSYTGLADGRVGGIIFRRSRLVDFENEIQQKLNGSPRMYKSYENNHEMDLDAEKDIFPEILQNNNAVEKLPYFYNNLFESHDKVADPVRKYSDYDFTKRVDKFDEVERSNYNPSEPGPGHGKVTSLPPKIEELEELFDENQSQQDKPVGLVLVPVFKDNVQNY